MNGFLKEFKNFLDDYNILSVAIAFISSLAINSLVKSFVDDIIMPIIMPITGNGTWEDAVLTLGPVQLAWGSFVSNLINFIILMLVVFLIVKTLGQRKRK